MTRRAAPILVSSIFALAAVAGAQDRAPAVVDPGLPGKAPSDAIVVFDGKDLAGFAHQDGKPASWEVKDGEIVCRPGSGSLVSRERFGDCQLHVEFSTPSMPEAQGQGRGNSGVYVQGRYEVQVLDSFRNDTYPNGSCGAIYGQHAPLVNVCRAPGEWQSFDIVFRAPRVDGEGRLKEKARVTVFHNGVVIHDSVTLEGPTGGAIDADVAAPGPLLLQDHGNHVRFRNIWFRRL